MISTVTASTVSTLFTTALAGSVALIDVHVLFALLLQKEVTTATGNKKDLQRLGMALTLKSFRC